MSNVATDAPTINRGSAASAALDQIRRSVPVDPAGQVRPDLLPVRAYLVACGYVPPSLDRILTYIMTHNTVRGLVANGLLARIDGPELERVWEASQSGYGTGEEPMSKGRPWGWEDSRQAARWAAEAFALEKRREELIRRANKARNLANKLGSYQRTLVNAAAVNWENPDRRAEYTRRAELAAVRRGRVVRAAYQANPIVASHGGVR